MNAHATMSEAELDEARRHWRAPLTGEVRSRHPGAKPYPSKIINLSPGGCCVELCYTPNLGERLWVTLPGIEPVECRVCWADKYQAGCAFLTPLYPAVFDHIRAKMEKAARRAARKAAKKNA